MKTCFATLALLGLAVVPAARGQAPAGGATRGTVELPTRVAVINIQEAITGTAEGKQAAAELQSQFAPRQTELENLSRRIQDLQNRLRTGATTLSDEEKVRLTREGDVLTRAFQRKQRDLQDDSSEAQREVVDRIGRKMMDVLDRFAKQNGYAVVIDTSAQNTPVIYASNQVDITQEIIRLFDQAYPVKAASPTQPKTGAARPGASNSKP